MLNKNKSILPDLPSLVLKFVFAAVLLLFVWLSFYSFPQADDWCFAAATRHAGHLGSVVGWYESWSGRYFSHWINSFTPATITPGYRNAIFYPIVPIAILVIFSASVCFLSRSALKIGNVGVGLVIVYLSSVSSITSALYWAAAANTYTVGLTCFLFFITALSTTDFQKRIGKGRVSFLLALAFLTIGCNEAIMLWTVSVVSGMTIWTYWRSYTSRKSCFILSLSTASLGCVVYFSPGTALRGASFPLRHQLLFSLEHSFFYLFHVYASWLSQPVLLSALLLVVTFCPKGSVLTRGYARLFFLASTIAATWIVLFAALWSMGQYPEPRTTDMPYFLFLIALVTVFSGGYPERFQKWRVGCQWVASGLFIIALFISSRAQDAVSDLRGSAPDLHLFHQKLMSKLSDCKTSAVSVCQLDDYPAVLPSTLVYSTITADPQHWRNQCVADATGLPTLRTQHDSQEKVFDRLPKPAAFAGKPLSELEKEGSYKILGYWGLGRNQNIHARNTGETLKTVSTHLPEGVMFVEKSMDRYLIFYRKNQWTGEMSAIDVALVPFDNPAINWFEPQECKGAEVTSVPLLFEASTVWFLDVGEQRIFEKTAAPNITCSANDPQT